MKSHSIKLIHDTAKINAKGEAPLYMRIIRDRKVILLALAVNIEQNHWNKKEQTVKKSHPNSIRFNNYLKKEIARVNDIIFEMATIKSDFSLSVLKNRLIQKAISDSLFERFEKHMKELELEKKYGSLGTATSIYSKLKKYLKDKDIQMNEIDVNFLKEYESYLRFILKNSVNTTHTNLKKIRKLINDAIREDMISENNNPFRKFKLKLENKEMTYLTEHELSLLENLNLEVGTAMLNHRNLFVFCSYTGGIRISDALNLRWKNYDGHKINFFIKKTGEQHSIKVPEKANDILNIYKERRTLGEDFFIFPILNDAIVNSDELMLHNDISSKTAYVNKNLGFIAKKCGITKKLNFHCSRHTFATLALSKGIRIEYVSKLMGHANIKMTQHYAKFINVDLENAMDIMNK